MARNFSPRKKRNKIISSPNQRIISHYFTPRSGINKEEVNFLVKSAANGEKRYPTTGVQGRTDQITFTPAFGFTTAAKLHQQAGGRYSWTENQQILSGQRNLGSTTCKCAVSGHVTCACSPLKNSSDSDKKQTHFDLTRVFGFMASSTSSSLSPPTSSSSTSSCPSPRNTRRTRVRRSNSKAQNHLKGRSANKQKRVPETITVDSEDENSISDEDCCVIMNVVRGRKLKSDSEVEESSSCSQSSTSTESSSQELESKGESTCSSSSSESNQKNTASCKKLSLSSKSVKQTKEQASAKSTFGLVGGDFSDSDDDDDDSQHLSQCDSDFAQVPVEIMENIFCQLPIVDLMLNCALVCHQWYDIISRDSVMASIIILRCIIA